MEKYLGREISYLPITP